MLASHADAASLGTFAAFGGFATLVLANFGGRRRDKLGAHIALAVCGSGLLVIGTLGPNTTFTKLAGYVTFAFAALGGYLFLSAASAATGGKGYPLGDPLVR